MKNIKDQVLAGTNLDAHGERNHKDLLESFAELHSGRRMPINQQHDLSLSSAGYAENLRVVPCLDIPGDWHLIADVYFEGEALTIPAGGFSISFLEMLRQGETQERIQVYLPYPYYKDENFIEEIFEDGFVAVGRWAKKSADFSTLALVGSAIVVAIKPVWEDLYKTQIAPHIYEFFSKKFNNLKNKGISADLVQYVAHENDEIQILLVPSRGKEAQCFEVEKLSYAMKAVHTCLTSQDPTVSPIRKVYLRFDEQTDAYAFYRVEYKDGTILEY